jgi:hypothetical protein
VVSMSGMRFRLTLCLLLFGSACAQRHFVQGPTPPQAVDVVRIRVSGSYVEQFGKDYIITDPTLINTLVNSRWFAADGWETSPEPLASDPQYIIQFEGTQGVLATYKSSPIFCLWISCPGWIGIERPDSSPLIRSMGEDAYLTFVHRLLRDFDRSAHDRRTEQ